jgi:alpha-tubulin suppressor-like RCC1 family protein
VVVDGLVSCWGRNTFGQAGSATVDMLTSPAIVAGTRGFERVSAGGFHTCGVRVDGSTRCWGWGSFGQLGDGLNASTATPVAAEGFTAAAVSAGSESTCGLATDGRMWCWGYDRHGVLGRGVAGYTSTPAVLGLASALPSATAVSVGSYHACAIVAGAPLQCWGYNNEGQIGAQGGLPQRPTPGPVAAVVGATAVSCGYQSTCAVVADGNVLCFGRNAQGQLGDGTTTPSRSPVTVRF